MIVGTDRRHGGIRKQKGPLLLPSCPVLKFNAWISGINTVRKAEAAEPNLSGGVLIINTRLCSAPSAAARRHSRRVLEIYAPRCAGALPWRDERERTRVRSPSRRHADLAIMQNRICLQTWKCEHAEYERFESFRNCTFGRPGVHSTAFRWKHKHEIQKGVNTSEGRGHSRQNHIQHRQNKSTENGCEAIFWVMSEVMLNPL